MCVCACPRARRWLSLLNCFSGGVFLAAGLVHLLPHCQESQERLGALVGDYPLYLVLITLGYMLVLFVERVLFDVHGSAHGHGPHTGGWAHTQNVFFQAVCGLRKCGRGKHAPASAALLQTHQTGCWLAIWRLVMPSTADAHPESSCSTRKCRQDEACDADVGCYAVLCFLFCCAGM